MSHDIRDPLNSIRLATDALPDVCDPSGAVKKHVEIVMREVNRHGGELEVKSYAGATLFRILLPRQSSQEPPVP